MPIPYLAILAAGVAAWIFGAIWFGAFGLATLALAWHLGRPAPVLPSPS